LSKKPIPLRKKKGADTSPSKQILTKKQEKCIELFVETNDKYYSYLKAGYLVKGKTAIQKCDMFFDNPKIKQAIELRTKNFELIEPSSLVYLTEEITRQLEECIGMGLPISKAVIIAGIQQRTYTEYFAQGRKHTDDGEYSENTAKFFKRMTRAKDTGEMQLLKNIKDASDTIVVEDVKTETDGTKKKVTKTTRTLRGNWQPSAWILERTRPESYGKDRPEDVDPDEEVKELGELFRENITGSFTLEPDDKESTEG